MNNKMIKGTFVVGALLVSGTAAAHSGHPAGDVMSGMLHPLTGLDHLAALLLVGVLAMTINQGRTKLLLPAVFIGFMALGMLLGALGHGLTQLELGLAASVLILGMLLVSRAQLPRLVVPVLVAIFAVFHGNAHGLEMSATQPLLYAGGLLLCSVAVQMVGLLVGYKLAAHPWALRVLGAMSGGLGISLMLGV